MSNIVHHFNKYFVIKIYHFQLDFYLTKCEYKVDDHLFFSVNIEQREMNTILDQTNRSTCLEFNRSVIYEK
jgi:hypothetical protein